MQQFIFVKNKKNSKRQQVQVSHIVTLTEDFLVLTKGVVEIDKDEAMRIQKVLQSLDE